MGRVDGGGVRYHIWTLELDGHMERIANTCTLLAHMTYKDRRYWHNSRAGQQYCLSYTPPAVSLLSFLHPISFSMSVNLPLDLLSLLSLPCPALPPSLIPHMFLGILHFHPFLTVYFFYCSSSLLSSRYFPHTTPDLCNPANTVHFRYYMVNIRRMHSGEHVICSVAPTFRLVSACLFQIDDLVYHLTSVTMSLEVPRTVFEDINYMLLTHDLEGTRHCMLVALLEVQLRSQTLMRRLPA